MSDWALYGLVFLIGAPVAHVLFVQAFPRLVMLVVGRVFNGPVNEMIHMPPTTASSRAVVRPSPDLLYSAVIYDVRKRPLLIEAAIPETYWSISFFANNTDNYFVENDRDIAAPSVRFLLVAKGGKAPSVPDGARVVEAQSAKGVVLLRSLVPDADRIDDLVAVQKQARCETV